MMTRGGGSQTINCITDKWFEKASSELLNGTYQYPKKRRVYIPKPGKPEKRAITISNPRTKIIEKAILMAIEPIFEGLWE